jgi:hypothetical protein
MGLPADPQITKETRATEPLGYRARHAPEPSEKLRFGPISFWLSAAFNLSVVRTYLVTTPGLWGLAAIILWVILAVMTAAFGRAALRRGISGNPDAHWAIAALIAAALGAFLAVYRVVH